MRSDLTRHMIGGSHEKDPDHTCRGVLRNGDAWGCGQRFSSSRELTDHLGGWRKDSEGRRIQDAKRCGNDLEVEDKAEQVAFLQRAKVHRGALDTNADGVQTGREFI